MEEKQEYNPIKQYLEHGLEDKEVFLWDEEIDKLLYYARKMDAYYANVGIRKERLEHNPREQAFHDQWLKENKAVTGVDFGQGILQDLFITHGKNALERDKIDLKINNRDRMIAATVMQWLGSNVGMSFLHEALGQCGYKIVSDKK